LALAFLDTSALIKSFVADWAAGLGR